VIEVREDSDKGGPGKSFNEEGNNVIMQHDDRTLGMYFHLKKNGAFVEPGANVEAGDLIGYSGNTGFSSGSHLHFEVTYTNRNATEGICVPVSFQTANGLVKCPEKGSILTAQ